MDGEYRFPAFRLRNLRDPTKTPLVLVACGSFSPITYLHLRMFEMARDHAHFNTNFEVVGGYLSPVNDKYKKKGLISSDHRFEMCKLACARTSDWLLVDPWEARQTEYTPTAEVLDHFDQELNEKLGGAESVSLGEDGEVKVEKKKISIMLLAGTDLIQTMSVPGVWEENDLHHILGSYGCFIIERADSEVSQALFKDSPIHSRNLLSLYQSNIHMVPQIVRNDVSSTKIRLFIKRNMSIRYLIPDVVEEYIRSRRLYIEDEAVTSTAAQNLPRAVSEENKADCDDGVTQDENKKHSDDLLADAYLSSTNPSTSKIPDS